jgi:hypothetical protein
MARKYIVDTTRYLCFCCGIPLVPDTYRGVTACDCTPFGVVQRWHPACGKCLEHCECNSNKSLEPAQAQASR